MASGKGTKFYVMVWAACFGRGNAVSTSAKPACMNMTRKPVMSVQTKLMEILLWPTVSMTSASVGFFGSFTGTSLAVPVVAPVGSAAGRAGAGAAGGAGAGAAGGAGAACGAGGTWTLTACVGNSC